MVCVISKASDQPAHTHSLIRVFASRLNILWVLSYWPNTIWSWLHRLVWVYTCQNATLLEITFHGSLIKCNGSYGLPISWSSRPSREAACSPSGAQIAMDTSDNSTSQLILLFAWTWKDHLNLAIYLKISQYKSSLLFPSDLFMYLYIVKSTKSRTDCDGQQTQ